MTYNDTIRRIWSDNILYAALVELTVFIAFANLSTRANTAHGITSQGYSDACEIPLAQAA